MYDLATLSHRYRYAGISTQNFREYEEWNNSAIQDFQKDPFTASNHAKDEDDPTPCPYSKDLMELVEECLKPAMTVRFKAQEVKAVTEKILARYGNDDGQQVNEKVYFRGNEINDMPLGREDFPFYDGREVVLPARQSDWSDIDQLMQYPNPDEPELKLPRWLKRFSKYKADRRREREVAYNKYWQENCRLEGGKIIFQDRPAGPITVQPGPSSNNATTVDVAEIPDSQEDDQVLSNAAADVTAASIAAIVAPAVAAAIAPVTAFLTAPLQATVEDDVPPGEESAQPSKAKPPPKKAPPKNPASATASGSGSGVHVNDNKKGANNKTKPVKAATGAGVNKTAAKKPVTTKAPAKRPTAKKGAAVATKNAPQNQAAAPPPPRRERLPRDAKKDIPAGKYKM